MILAVGLGFAVQLLGGIPDAALFGLLVGVIAAQFVPAQGSCGLPRRDPPGDGAAR